MNSSVVTTSAFLILPFRKPSARVIFNIFFLRLVFILKLKKLIMASLTTARDRYNSANSLLCLLQALEGRVTVVELRNEMSVS